MKEATSSRVSMRVSVDSTIGMSKGLLLKVGNTEEVVRVVDVSLPVYKHKSWIHKLVFNFTSLFLLCGWPQPKCINGGEITCERVFNQEGKK